MGSFQSKLACGCRHLLKGRYAKEYSIPSCESEVTIERTEREIRRMKARQQVAKRKGYLKARGFKRGTNSCAPQKVFQEEKSMKSTKNFLEMDTVEAIFGRLLDTVLGEEKEHSLAKGKHLLTTKEKETTSDEAKKVDPLNTCRNIKQEEQDNLPSHKIQEGSTTINAEAVKIYINGIISNAAQIVSDAKEMTSEAKHQPALDTNDNKASRTIDKGAIKIYVADIISAAEKIVQNGGENQISSEVKDVIPQMAPETKRNLVLDIKVEGTVEENPFEAKNQVPSEYVTEGAPCIMDMDAMRIYVEDLIESAVNVIQTDRKDQFTTERQPALGTNIDDTITALPYASYLPLNIEEEEAVKISVELPSKTEDLALDSEAKKVPSALSVDALQIDHVEMPFEANHLLTLDIAEENAAAKEAPNAFGDLPLDTKVEEEDATAEIFPEVKQQIMVKEANNSLFREAIKLYVNEVIVKAKNTWQNETEEHFKDDEYTIVHNVEEKHSSNGKTFEAHCHLLHKQMKNDEGSIGTTSEAVQQLSLPLKNKQARGTLNINAIKIYVDGIIASAVNVVQNDLDTPTVSKCYKLLNAEEEGTATEADDDQYFLSLDTKVEKKENMIEKSSENKDVSLYSTGEKRYRKVDTDVTNIVQKNKYPLTETDLPNMYATDELVTATGTPDTELLLPLDTKVEKEEALVEEFSFAVNDRDHTFDMYTVKSNDGSIFANAVNVVKEHRQTSSETKLYELDTAEEEEIAVPKACETCCFFSLDTKAEKEKAMQEMPSQGEETFLDSSDQDRDRGVDKNVIQESVDDTASSAAVQTEINVATETKSHNLGFKSEETRAADIDAISIFVDNVIANAVKVVSEELSAVSKEKNTETTSSGLECVCNDTVSKASSMVQAERNVATETKSHNLGFKNEEPRAADMDAISNFVDNVIANAVKVVSEELSAVSKEKNTETTSFDLEHVSDDTTRAASMIEAERNVANETKSHILGFKNEDTKSVIDVHAINIFADNVITNAVKVVSEELSSVSKEKNTETTSFDLEHVSDDTTRAASMIQAERNVTGDTKVDSLGFKKNEDTRVNAINIFVDNVIAEAVKVVSKELSAVSKEKDYETTSIDLEKVTDENASHCPIYGKKDDVTIPTMEAVQTIYDVEEGSTSASNQNLRPFDIKNNKEDCPNVKSGTTKIIADETVSNMMEDVPAQEENQEHSSGRLNRKKYVTVEEDGNEIIPFAANCVDRFLRLSIDDVEISADGVILNADVTRRKKASTHEPPRDDTKFGSDHNKLTAQGLLVEEKKDAVVMETPCAMAVLEKVVSMATALEMRQVSADGEMTNHPELDKKAAVAYTDGTNRENKTSSYSPSLVSSQSCSNDPVTRARSPTNRSNLFANTGPLTSGLGSDVSDNDVTEQMPAISFDGNFDSFITGKGSREESCPIDERSLSSPIKDLARESAKRLVKDTPDKQEEEHESACKEDNGRHNSTIHTNQGLPQGSLNKHLVQACVEENYSSSIIFDKSEKDRLLMVNLEEDHSMLQLQNDTFSSLTSTHRSSDKERHGETEPNSSSLQLIEENSKAKLDIAVDDDGRYRPDVKATAVENIVEIDRAGAPEADKDPGKDNQPPTDLEGPWFSPLASHKSSWIGAFSSVVPFLGLNVQENRSEQSPSVVTGNQEWMQLRPSESFVARVGRWFAGDNDDNPQDQAMPKDDNDEDGVEVEEKTSSSEFSKSDRSTEMEETLYELEQAQDKTKMTKLPDEYDIQDVIIAMKEFKRLQNFNSDPPGPVRMAFIAKFLKARDFMIDDAIKLYANYLVCRKGYHTARLTPFRNPLLAELYSGRFNVLDARDQHGAAIAVFTAHLPPLETNYDIIMNNIYLQLDEAIKSSETQEHGIVLLYDLSNTNYKTCDVQLCSIIIELIKTAYPIRLRKTLLVSPPFCFEIRLFSATVFRDTLVRENIYSVTPPNLTQHIPVTCIPTSLGGECDTNPLRMIEQCMLSHNVREGILVGPKTEMLGHSACGENDDGGGDAVDKGQSWFPFDEMPGSSLDVCSSPNDTCLNHTINVGSDNKRAICASGEEIGTEDSSVKCHDMDPRHCGEQKSCHEISFERIKPCSSEKRLNSYVFEDETLERMERMRNTNRFTKNSGVGDGNAKPCSPKMNINYSWKKDESIRSISKDCKHLHDATDAPEIKLCSSERRIVGPHVLDRPKTCPSEKAIQDPRGKHKKLEHWNQRNNDRTGNDDTILVGANSSSVLGNTERGVRAGYLISHYRYADKDVPRLMDLEKEIRPRGVAQEMNGCRELSESYGRYRSEERIDKHVPTLERYEINGQGHIDDDVGSSSKMSAVETTNEPQEDEVKSFIPRVLADPMTAVYNFFKF